VSERDVEEPRRRGTVYYAAMPRPLLCPVIPAALLLAVCFASCVECISPSASASASNPILRRRSTTTPYSAQYMRTSTGRASFTATTADVVSVLAHTSLPSRLTAAAAIAADTPQPRTKRCCTASTPLLTLFSRLFVRAPLKELHYCDRAKQPDSPSLLAAWRTD